MVRYFVQLYNYCNNLASRTMQEKGKVTFEEFTLDAERRAHGMRL